MERAALETLIARARTLPREQFAACHPGRFLLVRTADGASPTEFDTRVSDERPTPASKNAWVDVIAVAKAEGNPYPDRISVGRAGNCDVVLRDPSVSKLHAHFKPRSNGAMELMDLASQNGTLVNGHALASCVPEPIAVDDELQFGYVLVRFVDANALYTLLQSSERAPRESANDGWQLAKAKNGEACRWQCAGGRWVTLTLDHSSETGNFVVAASSDGRRERSDSYENALALAKSWRT